MYQLSFLSSAKKEFKKLDKVAQKLIKKKLLLLCEDPTKLKNNLKPLKGKNVFKSLEDLIDELSNQAS